MDRQEYESLCSAARSGVGRYVENVETHETGRVVACRRDRLEVDVYGKRELWPQEASEPTATSTPDLPI